MRMGDFGRRSTKHQIQTRSWELSLWDGLVRGISRWTDLTCSMDEGHFLEAKLETYTRLSGTREAPFCLVRTGCARSDILIYFQES